MHTGLSLWNWKWSSNNTIHLTFAYIKKVTGGRNHFFFHNYFKNKVDNVFNLAVCVYKMVIVWENHR